MMTKQSRIQRVARRPTAVLLRRVLRNKGDGVRGAAAIEFAVLAALLLTMMIGTADLGMGFYRKMQVQNAAQAGAQYAMAHAFEDTGMAAVEDVVRNATSFSDIVAVPQPYRFDGCPTANGVIAPDAELRCPDGSTPGAYVSVSAQAAYKTIVPLPLLGIPDRFILEARSVVRVQ